MQISDWLTKPQRHIGGTGLMVLIVMGSLMGPISLDMYTPSIPQMTTWFDTTPAWVNLTLVGYFFFYAAGMLIFGALSDTWGRKRVLAEGMGFYVLSSVLCAWSINIEMLIGARVLQALASGAISAACTAVVKDAVKPEYREKMLSAVQIMFVIGPVIAPLCGATIAQFFAWPVVFYTLAAIGLLGFGLALGYEETLHESERICGSWTQSLKGLVTISRNKAFMIFLILTSGFEIAFMAYIAVGSYIYIDYFGLTEIQYGLYFAVAALLTALGPLFWLKISGRVSIRNATTISFIAAAVTGVGMLAIGHAHPALFCLSFVAFAFIEAVVKPYSVNLLLNQQERGTGSASALINFTRTLLGVVGMVVIIAPWPDYISGIALLIVVTMIASMVVWGIFLRTNHGLKGIE